MYKYTHIPKFNNNNMESGKGKMHIINVYCCCCCVFLVYMTAAFLTYGIREINQ